MKLSILTKQLGSAGLLIVLMILVGVLGIMGLSSVASVSHSMYANAVKPLASLGVARAKVNESRAYLNNHILEHSHSGQAALEAKIAQNTKAAGAALAAVKPTLQTAGGREAYAHLIAALSKYDTIRSQVLALSRQGKDAQAYALNKSKAVPAFAAVDGHFTEIFDSK
ncbi:MAG: MCP four helix bundle domain-containing protein, partial [Solirubrobacteraceae bacterium]